MWAYTDDEAAWLTEQRPSSPKKAKTRAIANDNYPTASAAEERPDIVPDPRSPTEDRRG